RLPGGFDAVLSRAALPARLQRLPDGLRVGDGHGAARRLVRRHARDGPQVAQVGAPGGAAVTATTASVPLVRRKPPAAVRRKQFLIAVANHSLLIATALMFLAPFLFIVLTSLMTNNQALSANLWPHPFRLQNFADVFHQAPLLRWTLNTMIYSVLGTIGVLVSSVPVAYALARIRWRGREVAFMIVLIALMLPPQVSVVPLYVMWSKLHLVGTLWPLIVPNWLGDAFSIFLLRQFFMTIPEEYLDAARFDR